MKTDAKLYCNKIRSIMEGASQQAQKNKITQQTLGEVVAQVAPAFRNFLHALSHPEVYADTCTRYTDLVDHLYLHYGKGDFVISEKEIQGFYEKSQSLTLKLQSVSSSLLDVENKTSFNYRWVSNGVNICADTLSAAVRAALEYESSDCLRDHINARRDYDTICSLLKQVTDGLMTVESFIIYQLTEKKHD